MLAIETYLVFVHRESVSPERTNAHEEMMWQMHLNGIQFQDRDDARVIALQIEADGFEYQPQDAIEWIILAWHQSLNER